MDLAMARERRGLRDRVVSVLLTSSDPAIMTATSRTVTFRERIYFPLIARYSSLF